MLAGYDVFGLYGWGDMEHVKLYIRSDLGAREVQSGQSGGLRERVKKRILSFKNK